MVGWLKDKPFQCLTPTKKAALLAYVCNELLCNKDVAAYVLNFTLCSPYVQYGNILLCTLSLVLEIQWKILISARVCDLLKDTPSLISTNSPFYVCSEIEGNIDTINNLRRDKWIVEGKLRQ